MLNINVLHSIWYKYDILVDIEYILFHLEYQYNIRSEYHFNICEAHNQLRLNNTSPEIIFLYIMGYTC